ncbi:MAG: hypothetical protein IGQ45_14645 [Cyanobacterium sp. T60_A2020_053]|nr:hypothetical protein [Cyanobacterium sp. T60_A2020_053]
MNKFKSVLYFTPVSSTSSPKPNKFTPKRPLRFGVKLRLTDAPNPHVLISGVIAQPLVSFNFTSAGAVTGAGGN